MTQIIHPVPAAPWVAQLFSSQSAQKGAVVRRSRRWVEREVGRDAFERELRRRGYHLIETGDQMIVVCHAGPIRIVF